MSTQTDHHPIGVFDSGLGGLTVVKEIMRFLPQESIVYFGDTARVPYGTKSKEAIIRFSQENAGTLLKHRVKMIVIACNSSSSYALEILQNQLDVPVIGVIEPGARKAVASTQNRRIGVIATSATIKSQRYPEVIRHFDRRIEVFSQACPLFVPLVEEGWLKKKVVFDVARHYLSTLKQAHVDTLILGCTHYPLLKLVLQKTMGKKVGLVDSAKEVAIEVKTVLARLGKLNDTKKKPKHKFMLNDRPQQFQRIAREFLGFHIQIKLELSHV